MRLMSLVLVAILMMCLNSQARQLEAGDQILLERSVSMTINEHLGVPMANFRGGKLYASNLHREVTCSLRPEKAEFLSRFGSATRFFSVSLRPRILEVLSNENLPPHPNGGLRLKTQVGEIFDLTCGRLDENDHFEVIHDRESINRALGRYGKVLEEPQPLESSEQAQVEVGSSILRQLKF